MEMQASFRLDDIKVEPRNGRLIREGETIEVEPQVMELLCVLADAGGEAVSREALANSVWQSVTVNDEALGRAVWKLRKALGDDARNPSFIATVPKRGYRLLVAPGYEDAAARAVGVSANRMIIAAVLLAVLALSAFLAWQIFPGEPDSEAPVTGLIDRADDFYAQITEEDNAAAARLYERALVMDPDSAPARAGLANTLTQSVVRWSPGDWPEFGINSRIQTALRNGRTATPAARHQLQRAIDLASEAVDIDPRFAPGYRALGLALSANGQIDEAMEAYNRAVTLDPDNWESMINLSDMHAYRDEADLSLSFMIQAYNAMTRRYEADTAQIRPWHSLTGRQIAEEYAARGEIGEAERWYRRVLHWDPLNAEVVASLAELLLARGDLRGAREICAVLPTQEAISACQTQ